jgi:tetratricopeptide (TPR) repeat protein
MPRLPTPSKFRKSALKLAQNQQAKNQLHDLFMQGLILHQRGELNQAKAIYETVIQVNPQHFDALHLLGVLASQTDNDAVAVELIDKAIQINSSNEVFYSNRGIALRKIGRLRAAIDSFDTAIRLRSDYAEAYSNKGVALHELRRMEAAVASYDMAIKMKPDYFEAHSNRGAALRDLKLLKDAIASFDRAISIRPDYADAHWNKGLALLMCGDFVNGLPLYEWRWKRDKFTSRKLFFRQPLWLGVEPLKGKVILLHCEQGLGDTIQFCRYTKMVKERGAHVLLEVQKSLTGLVQTLDGVDEVIEMGTQLPEFDYHCPLMSLPLAFKTTIDSAPGKVPYLRASVQKIELWKRRPGEKSKLRVGLVWSGSAGLKGAPERSITLEMLLPHLPDGIEYICLQKELREVDTAVMRTSSIQYFGEEISDFSDTAALCELMDLIISIDTSTAHLAGALGKKTWVLLPYVADWRWLMDRDDSIWYDSTRLFRQHVDNDWSTVLQRIALELNNAYPDRPLK